MTMWSRSDVSTVTYTLVTNTSGPEKARSCTISCTLAPAAAEQEYHPTAGKFLAEVAHHRGQR
jgi:hypothetical protein